MPQPLFDLASDRPIENRSQDKLRRSTFAEKAALAIGRRQRRESFVIALQGPWGCGKSSIKNMILDAIGGGEGSPAIVDFAPWQLRDADTLFSTFFDEIALAIGEAGGDNSERKARLTAYGKQLTLGGSTVKAIGTLAGVLGIPGAKVVEILGEKMGDAAKVTLEGAETIGEKSLKQVKSDLKESLRDLNRPVLVVIDDIDRLEIEEMLLVFQLIKANADFPNFTYLLLLHREVVESALMDKIGGQGRDYLEKIIQLPIDVPPINKSQRHQLFLEGLKEICESWELTLLQEQDDELDELWDIGLSDVLQYPRDVRRLLNALEFSGALLIGEAGWEVNPTDFIALEALRIQEPKVYQKLPTLKGLLTGPKPSTRRELLGRTSLGRSVTQDEKDDEQPGRTEMDYLIGLISPNRREAVCEILSFVFPQAEWAFLPSNGLRFERSTNRLNRKLQAGESRYFDRYFALSIPDDQLSEAEIIQIISSVGDKTVFEERLKKLYERELLALFLQETQSRLELVPMANYEDFLSTILELGELPERNSQIGFLGSLVDMNAYDLFNEILMCTVDIEARGQLFHEVVARSKAMRFPIRWIWDEENSRRGNERTKKWATEEQLARLRAFVTERIGSEAMEDRLEQHPQVQMLVRFWAESESDKVKEWIKDRINTESGLRFFLNQFCSKSYIVNDPPLLHEITFQPDVMSWLTDIESIKTQLEETDKSQWSELEKVIARKFDERAGYLVSQDQQSGTYDTSEVEPEFEDM